MSTKAYREANREQIVARRKSLRGAGYYKAWYAAHREKALAAAKVYYKANRERITTYQKERVKANPERVSALHKAWRRANPEKVVAWAKTWRKTNPEKAAETKWRYRLGPSAPPELIDALAMWSMVRRELNK